jgi:hypothetical protein
MSTRSKPNNRWQTTAKRYAADSLGETTATSRTSDTTQNGFPHLVEKFSLTASVYQIIKA